MATVGSGGVDCSIGSGGRDPPPPLLFDEENEEDMFSSSHESLKVNQMDHGDEKDDDIFAEAKEELSLDSPENDWSQSTAKTEGLLPKVAVLPSVTAASVTSQSLPKQPKNGVKDISDDLDEEEEANKYSIEISVTDPKKIGDGMNAYMAYKVITKTNIPDFRNSEMEVYRRFSDFLGLHEKLVEKHLHQGRIIPPPPEKSVIGMTKIKMSKEESGSTEFVEQRRAALERFLCCVAKHPALQTDPSFVDFLELEGDLPRATSTSALSGAGVMRLFNRVGDSLGKMTYKMDESDQWFEEKQQQVESLDIQLKKLHSSIETLVINRKELAQNTGLFANSAAALGSVEEHTSLSRVLSQLAEVEDKIDLLHVNQADSDYYILSEFVKDYVGLIQAVKDVFHERVKLYKAWKEDEATLTKKREAKVRLELTHKTDKIGSANQEIAEWEHRVEKSQEEFQAISKSIIKELKRFERQRLKDFRRAIISYLESLMENQQQLIKYWETFLPETKAIA